MSLSFTWPVVLLALAALPLLVALYVFSEVAAEEVAGGVREPRAAAERHRPLAGKAPLPPARSCSCSASRR